MTLGRLLTGKHPWLDRDNCDRAVPSAPPNVPGIAPRLRAGPDRVRYVRVCPGGTGARTMIMWIPQLISCGIHMKSEILSDDARPARGRRAPVAARPSRSPRATQVDGIGVVGRERPPRKTSAKSPAKSLSKSLAKGLGEKRSCGRASASTRRIRSPEPEPEPALASAPNASAPREHSIAVDLIVAKKSTPPAPLARETPSKPPPESAGAARWVVLIMLLIVAGVAAYVLFDGFLRPLGH